MIHSFHNQGTEDIFNGKASKVARAICPQDLWKRSTRKLDQIDSAASIDDLKVPPGNRLELL
jgi:proteic killer suppression protein